MNLSEGHEIFGTFHTICSHELAVGEYDEEDRIFMQKKYLTGVDRRARGMLYCIMKKLFRREQGINGHCDSEERLCVT